MQKTDLTEHFSKLRNGDKSAFTEIYHELKRPVYTIALRIVQSKETAEDITQEIFMRLYASPPDASVRNPRAWCFQITRNLAIDLLKKQHEVQSPDTQDTFAPISDIELRMDLERAISHLPCEEREILTLHLNGGLHFKEISKIVGLTLPSVYRRYQKALKSLRILMNGGSL
ncbi:MAG: RNA polymerase sigma factor [Oscillospiraceae bacterium]|nr:RNA polymerase sigma factor [Oscillospiraceae bacterium]